MTALARRRRRSTIVAALAAVVVVVAAVGLVAVGASALYNSTDGADAVDRRVETVFAATPNGVLAAVDDDGDLASIAVLTLRPSCCGGSVVTIPVSADASGGFGRERLPLAETVALQGVDGLEQEVESLLRVDVDRADVVDEEALRSLLAPLGELDVDLPVAVTDDNGDEIAPAGRQTIDAAGAAAILTARDDEVPAAEQFPASSAVWEAIGAAVGETGVEPYVAVGTSVDPAALPLDRWFALLTSGAVRERALSSAATPEDENPRQVDSVRLDAAEVALVFGQISPGQVSAPNVSLAFRVVSAFSDEQLAGAELSNADVAYSALARLIYTNANVISVSTASAEAPPVTIVYIAEESMRAGVVSGAPDLFGEVEVRVAERRISGVDAVIELGESYLTELEESPELPVAPEASVTIDDEETDG